MTKSNAAINLAEINAAALSTVALVELKDIALRSDTPTMRKIATIYIEEIKRRKSV
jgi:hypothetical protein